MQDHEDEQQSESVRLRNQRAAARMTLDELQGYVDQALAGELAVVPDGLPDVIRRLRSDLTSALGPQEAGDLVPIFRGIEARLARLQLELRIAACVITGMLAVIVDLLLR